MPRFEVIGIENIPIIQQGDDIAGLITSAVQDMGLEFEAKDILVIAHTIISRAEGKIISLSEITPTSEALKLAAHTDKDPRIVQLILDESSEVVACRPGLIITRHKQGWVAANSAVDQSNVGGEDNALILPEYPDSSAAKIGARIERECGVLPVGVVVSDSMGRALRRGIVNVAIGSYRFPGTLDQRGRQDLFGHTLRGTITAPADELTCAAELIMGQADEAMPVILIRGLEWSEHDGETNPETGEPICLPASSLARSDSEMLFGAKTRWTWPLT